MKKQMLALTDECVLCMADYLIKAIQRCQTWAIPEILSSLASVFYENVDKLQQYHDTLLGKHGILVQIINNDVTDTETLKEAVVCVQCLTLRPKSESYLSQVYIDSCYNVFTMLLHKMSAVSMDPLVQCKILMYCLRGIQNILRVTKDMPVDRLGVILAAVRTYMFYGVGCQSAVLPDSLYPSPFTRVEVPKSGTLTPKQAAIKKDDTANKKSKRKTKKKTDTKDPSKQKGSKQPDNDSGDNDLLDQGQSVSGQVNLDFDYDPMAGYATWSKVSSSDSEWSDTEGGQGSRSRSNCTKVRQCALSCFFWIAKFSDKKVMFSYWSSFIPDSQSSTNASNAQSLLNIVLKDPSPKCRMGALAALSILLDNTKLLLSAAEDSDSPKPSTFTSYSIILGSTIQEIHRCLFLAMATEDYAITLTQLIKCFGTVIANVPYHRMRPGLLGKIVKHIRHFINHRDPNVRVACLTCLGSMAGIQPPLMEVCHIIQPSRPPITTKPPTELDSQPLRTPDTALNVPAGRKDLDSGFSSSPNINSPGGVLHSGGERLADYSGGTTPTKGTAQSSGSVTPAFSDQLLQMHSKERSWVVKLCVKNILPLGSAETVFSADEVRTEPLPIRLESLQVLANLTKGYFPVIRNCVPLLKELIHQCFCDVDPVIKLHAAKLLDEFTQVLQQDVNAVEASDIAVAERLSKQQVLEFWLSLLNGPIQEVLQMPGHDGVKAVACDCLANIGDPVFRYLPLDKRVMCLTVVLGLASDEDRIIRAAAIRTLGIFVMYKSLREDVSFVADCATAILGAMEDKNMFVKVKAAWSLANLGDAVASNREESGEEFMEEFSDVLMLNIITVATRLSQDADKLKPNAVRTLGNILRCMTKRHLGKDAFQQAVLGAVKSLVKSAGSGAMKVRWNASYAISNMYKNLDLNQGQAPWNADVLGVLCSVIRDCKNFKVRINAAIGLSSPRKRAQYGAPATYCRVWVGIIEAFETAEDIADYIDFRYRDNLIEQICIAVFHLIELVTVEDTDHLWPVLEKHGSQLSVSLNKYYTSKGKQSALEAHLERALITLVALQPAVATDLQRQSVIYLTTLSNNLKSGCSDDLPLSRPVMAFRQTYD
ncbi:HEAT repeat-containing protein 6-like isoform X2 [Dreissena polymorpha]|nr:HEAT repeat-containing protein 6-like isoform X2 [Dreissena polymorpha]